MAPINPLVGAGLISAGSNVVGGLFGAAAQSSANKTNLRIARENNAANQQLQRDQNNWNLQQWNRENEYNSASSQRQRLQAAGYNPALAVAQVATGSATSNQLQSAPYTPNNQVQVQPVNYGQGIANAGQDFVNSYLNMSMTATPIKPVPASRKNIIDEAYVRLCVLLIRETIQ